MIFKEESHIHVLKVVFIRVTIRRSNWKVEKVAKSRHTNRVIRASNLAENRSLPLSWFVGEMVSVCNFFVFEQAY